jgi:hypothetical protein
MVSIDLGSARSRIVRAFTSLLGCVLVSLSGATTARAQDPLGPFHGIYTVAGSLGHNGPYAPDVGVATAGWFVRASAPALLADGDFLIGMGSDPGIVVRVTRDGRSILAAGRPTPGCIGLECSPGPPGDGGPAIRARLRAPTAVAATSEGGFLIADELAAVVRRVAPDGKITTVLGQSDDGYHSIPAGLGGPSAGVALSSPSSLAVAPDGRVYVGDSGLIVRMDPDGITRLVADVRPLERVQLAPLGDGGVMALALDGTGDRAVIQQVALDGRVSTLARLDFPAAGLVALPDGAALTIDQGTRRVLRVAPTGALDVVLDLKALRDFAGREPLPNDPREVGSSPAFMGLALNAEGLFIVADGAVLLAPRDPATRLMVHIRDARVATRRVRLLVETTQPGPATLDARRYRLGCCRVGARVAAAVVPTATGAHWLQLPISAHDHGFASIRVRVTAGNATAQDSVPLLLGQRLPYAVIRDTMDGLTRDQDVDLLKYRCRRLSRRRIDCWTRPPESHTCEQMTAFRAGHDGVVRQRDYACRHGRPHYRRHPRWSGPTSITDVSGTE